MNTVTFAGPRMVVDLETVAANTRVLARHARGDLMAVVKADGFGHGAVGVARAALGAGASWLGVTGLPEALALRAAGLEAPILSWLNPLSADFAHAVGRRIDLAVPSAGHLAAMPPGARVHLHLDTGMARDGADPAEWAALCRDARRAEIAGRIEVVGVMSHLAGPDTAGAVRHFTEGLAVAHAAGLRPRLRHLAATSATLTAPETHFDLVRVGAGLVGINPTASAAAGTGAGTGAGMGTGAARGNPTASATAASLTNGNSGRGFLRGAMTLTAPVVEVRRVAKGTPVGYDHTWRAPKDTTLALLPLGYADGLPRTAGPQAEVLLGGRRFRLAGRISMDQIVIDTENFPVRPDDLAVIFGPGTSGEPTIADWAAWAGTLPHEIVTGLGPRTPRHIQS